MKCIHEIFRQSKRPGDFAKGYFRYLKQILDTVDLDAVNALVEAFENARLNGNTIFVVGNGGSATTASSMANDLGFDVIKKAGVDKTFRVLALTDNNAVITAIANDVGYEDIFVNQLKIHYRPGDILLAISASGNSSNVLKAAEWVKSQGGQVVGFLGFDGGLLKNRCDIAIHAKTMPGEYGPVEDLHLIINHVLAHWFQMGLKKDREEN